MPVTSNVSGAAMPPDGLPRRAGETRLERFFAGRLVCLAVSVLLLAPCYWQPRVQAGDLSSHIYNSWLAQLIESGRAQGLIVAPQTTNVLFDLVLSALFRLFGAEAAQRIAVSLAAPSAGGGLFSFSYSANPGLSYVVQSSPNLVDWVAVVTNAAASRMVPFSEGLTAAPSRYYRVGLLPNP